MPLLIDAIKAFEDNYIWVIHNQKQAIIVDPGDSNPVEKYLKKYRLDLVAILITHHHFDHIGGVKQLISSWDCDVYAPKDKRLEFEYKTIKEGDEIQFDKPNIDFKVIETPGHTTTHICFHNDDFLFCGDTLFSMGCGRMFEGTPEQFNASLKKLKSLNESLKVYCTHEYTLSNIQFAQFLEPNNSKLNEFKEKVTILRSQDQPSLPSTIKIEKQLNPFLRTDDVNLQETISNKAKVTVNNEIDCFKLMRQLKDIF